MIAHLLTSIRLAATRPLPRTGKERGTHERAEHIGTCARSVTLPHVILGPTLLFVIPSKARNLLLGGNEADSSPAEAGSE